MMHWLRTTWSRGWAALRKDRLDREFDEEVTTHLELLIDEGRRNGMSAIDARRDALRKLGRPELIRDVHRDQRGMPILDVLAQDLRYAVRMLWKSRAFTTIAALSLALGIGANTALFSLVDNLLLRSLPVRAPERLVQVHVVDFTGPFKKPLNIFSPRVFDDIRAHAPVFSEIIGFNRLDRPTVTIDGVADPPREVEQVSENFFRDLGVVQLVGRTPEPSDGPVAIISYRLWQDRFGGSPSVVGRALTVDGRVCSIVGVAPPRFRGLSIETSTDLWMTSRTGMKQMIARLKPGVTAEQAQLALQPLVGQFTQDFPPEVRRDMPPLHVELPAAGRGISQLRAQYERPLLALTALVTLVLLITCTNVGNLLMVRNTARRLR
jgi:hypothetical protein